MNDFFEYETDDIRPIEGLDYKIHSAVKWPFIVQIFELGSAEWETAKAEKGFQGDPVYAAGFVITYGQKTITQKRAGKDQDSAVEAAKFGVMMEAKKLVAALAREFEEWSRAELDEFMKRQSGPVAADYDRGRE